MSTTVQEQEQKHTPPKMGWGELSLYIVSAVLIIVCCVLEGEALKKGLSETEALKTGDAIEMIWVLSSICFEMIWVLSSICLTWYILALLGRFFLRKVLNIQRNVSYLRLFLKSDLIAAFFSNLSSIIVLFIAFTLGENMLLAFSTTGAVVGLIVHAFAWYPSLRYVLNKEGIYQPGVIKSYVWMWCKWVFFPLLCYLLVILVVLSLSK